MNEDDVKELLNTATIAKLYEDQGYLMDALSVYYYLLGQYPSNEEFQVKIDLLESKAVSQKEKKVVELLHEWFEHLIPEQRGQVLSKIKEKLSS